MMMLEQLDNYDWGEAFAYAGEPDGCGSVNVDAVPGATCKRSPFTREDVATIKAISEGENDGNEWLCCGQLKDGRWFFLTAGCDYTGWDCQASGSAVVSDSLEDLIQFGIGEEDLTRLSL